MLALFSTLLISQAVTCLPIGTFGEANFHASLNTIYPFKPRYRSAKTSSFGAKQTHSFGTLSGLLRPFPPLKSRPLACSKRVPGDPSQARRGSVTPPLQHILHSRWTGSSTADDYHLFCICSTGAQSGSRATIIGQYKKQRLLEIFLLSATMLVTWFNATSSGHHSSLREWFQLQTD
ncbi:unnamed protein product [Protopolystoma xenopodis]|uniref:Secreted protein n=1 Tax=Protopolystoma xenopodis TaxID=117903 RepID=A0A3S5A5W4_9PLAT|nr:unnamed protein product [Protopolystoma xenopodis]